MSERPRTVYILILLWLALSGMFVLWGGYSLVIFIEIPGYEELGGLLYPVHFGYLVSTIVWFVFSFLFVIFSYATFRGEGWAWTTGLIISTIFLIVFGLMLAAFIVNAIRFLDWFSVYGLISVILSFLTDIGIIIYITRPITKIYFAKINTEKISELVKEQV
ncbi:MAG: hypothetical protein JSU91_07340 [Thermoplasmatales archaeon]|nr:MAG: hypothetical protein JSU91_07340 [Thermoplasmatales archaeon]